MSEYSSVPPATGFNQSSAFAAALQRAKQIAAKINPNATGGDNRGKRPLEDAQELNTEPEAKKGPGLPASNQAPPLNRTPSQSGMGPGNGQHLDEMEAPGKMGGLRMNNMGMGGPGPRSSLEIMIPGPKVGLIIGKGGETIKQLQEKSGAKMVVIQDGPNQEHEKPLVISGDPSKIEIAKQLVYDLIAEKEMKSFNRRGGPRHDNRQDQFSEFGGNGGGGGGNELEVLVPKPAVGVVIGKGGDMIKKIQAETGARVQFQQNRDEGPGDRRCYLSGNPKQVEQARMRIEELIDSVLQRDGSEGGGNGGGGGMGGMRGGRGGGRGGRGGGGHMGGDRFDRNRNGGGDYGGNQQWEDRSGGGGRGGGGHHPGGHQGSEVSFMVPANKCGIIIGRGGETIKQINAQSGAYCELDRRTSNQNPTDKTFTIQGDPDQIESAKRIIQEKLQIPLNFVMSGGPAPMSSNIPTAYPSMAPQGYNPQSNWAVPGGYQQQWGAGQGGDQVPPQQPQVNVNPGTGQPDYSLQWAEYYRTLGMHREAEMIEQQAKAKATGGAGAVTPAAMGQGASAAPLGGVPTAAPSTATPAVGGGQPDYSAQWADYYRSIGKIKEAEAIEAQMKNKGGSSQPAAPAPPGAGPAGGGQAAAAAVAAAAAAAGGYQPSYGGYQPQTGYYGSQPQGVPVPSNVPQGGYGFPGYSGYGQQNAAPPSNQDN